MVGNIKQYYNSNLFCAFFCFFITNIYVCKIQPLIYFSFLSISDVNQSGEIDLKDFELAIEVSINVGLCFCLSV